MRLIAILLAACLAACSGGNDMNVPAVAINNPSIVPTVTASSTATGYTAADVLVGNELSGWKPVIASPVFSDAAITDLPVTASLHSFVWEYNNWLYIYTDSGAVMRLDLDNPTGSWDNAGVTDAPGGSLFYKNCGGGVYNGRVYVGPFNMGGFYSLDLSSPAGAWSTHLLSGNTVGAYATVSGQYLFLGSRSGAENDMCLVDLENIAAGTNHSAITDLPTGERISSLRSNNDYLYATTVNMTGTVSRLFRISIANLTGSWESITLPDAAVYGVVAHTTLYSGRLAFVDNGYILILDDVSLNWTVMVTAGVFTFWSDYVVHDDVVYCLPYRTIPSATSATRLMDLGSNRLMFDVGYARAIESISGHGDGAAGGVVIVEGATGSTYADAVQLAMVTIGQNGSFWVDLRSNTTPYQYWRLRFIGIGSDFVIRHIQLGGLLLLPWMNDGADLENYKTDGNHLVSSSGYYIGSIKHATMRQLALNWGQVTREELSAFQSWAEHAIAQMKPFYFIPDTDSSLCHFCWCNDGQKFTAPSKLGLYNVGTITVNTRRA